MINDFGAYVKKNREYLNYTQAELANTMNERFGHRWHQTVVGKIENGTRDLKASELCHLATIFGHTNITYPIAQRIHES